MKLYTIGYSGKNADKFFQSISRKNIKKVLDIRLYNTSQLAGFSKRDDLKFFLESICNCEYRHLKILAPSPELLKNYKDKKVSWEEYEIEYNQYLASLRFNDFISRKELDSGCFLCAEPTAEKCHRRLVAEYIQSHMDNVEIIHL
jgi:uncharacterized protein (DUF488 family)